MIVVTHILKKIITCILLGNTEVLSITDTFANVMSNSQILPSENWKIKRKRKTGRSLNREQKIRSK
jgi:hypothetical protein